MQAHEDECEVAQNPTVGPRQMYVVREAGYHATPSHRLRGEIDLGMDPHTDSSDTEDTPETYTQGMAPLSLLPTMAPIKTSGDLVVFRKYGESEQDLIGTRLHCLHALAKVEYISGQKIGCSWWGTIWRCSRQAWNTGTSYECDEQMARGVVTYSQLRGLTKPVLSHISNPYYPLHRRHAMTQEYARRS